ncbi:polar amino acid ABC transporter, inner membrane subunit [Gluconacetobacter diazotrophicus PA1 5]|uniref:ABC transporter substrate-binding protein/permease n=2 Tax=Gluconacetobacter diazotrophicus TaxID=33996 RepID=A0A7W4NIF2_GLUDI|nr:polar amino acid ABC transporter, inner membrane subunit [Gluconacetobacter diazotrophicus PA1 5]MBB2158306.1 ABC transporter substrate-binding protein/permease [Gluconacetobacter diazotrophicus]TWB00670.1 amino acid ABC transporter substrate-binding protein (PAAT family) /amino acid ABC transporter membrane protein (PAAT family) [Gluconacetobacter diazotrophicus]
MARLLAGFLVLLLAGLGAAFGPVAPPARAQTPPRPAFAADGTLTVCTNPTLPPMSFMGGAAGGDMVGEDIDVGRALGAYWHVPVTFVSMDFVGLFPSLAAGRCGIVISGVLRQQAREARFDAVPYQPTALVVVARAGTARVASMAALSGKVLAVQSGTSYAARVAQENTALAAAGRPPIIIQQYPTEDEVVQQVLIGRAFAFVSQDVELYFRQAQLHGKVAVIVQPDYPEYRDFAIYMRKDAQDRARLQDAVTALRDSGQMAQIRQRWQITPAAAAAVQGADGPAGGFDARVFLSALASPAFLRGAGVTLVMAVLSHMTAIVIAIPMALVLNGRDGLLKSGVRAYVALFRAAPTLLQLLFVWNALPQFLPVFREAWFTPFLAAWISLSINEAAYQVEINRAALQAIDPGQALAGDALGMTRMQVYRHVIFPQALRIALPPTINEFISLIKTTSLASVISLQELLAVTQINVARTFAFTEYYAAALVYYLLIVFFFLGLQRRIERRFAWADRLGADRR